MDPLHPIVLVPPNIPPVMPAPNVGRVNRDRQQRGRGEQDPQQEPSPDKEPAEDESTALPRRRTYGYGDDDEPDGGRPRLDITA
jgi:hypothetical protein